jgi:mono/diheme cytochrome c family protein
MAGCNECHTEGYARTFGKVAENEWLKERAYGEVGPWGTTFPANVRLRISELSEQQWLDRVRQTATRPPMPWYNLRAMTDADLRAIYRFISALGPAGEPSPEYLPPGEVTSYPHTKYPAEIPEPKRTGRMLSDRVSANNDPLVHRGRYLVQIAWCNSCHTEGYAMHAGDVPEDDWLLGSALGRNGSWGTTYPTNLRLYMQQFTEEQWIERARTLKTRPVMPWFALNEMTEEDLKAMYRYVRLLGPAGEAAPAFLPPEVQPSGSYVTFVRPSKK